MPALNYNYNYNYSVVTGGSGGSSSRPRFDTDVYSRLTNTTPGHFVVPVPAPNYPLFPSSWDADLQSYMYLDDFLHGNPGWRAKYAAVATINRKPPQNLTQAEMNDQALWILQMALEREDRFSEVIDQDDGEGAMNYFVGMLRIDPSNNPATNLLMRVARRVGEHIVMCLKGDFRSPRPSELCPAIEPMLDPPRTPSFPAGHAVQSYLIAYLLAYCMPKFPQQTTPLPQQPQYPNPRPRGLLFDLAERISVNRIVAGVHYPTDIEAGEAVAIACFNDLTQVPSIHNLQQAVRGEFPQYN